MEDLEVTKIVRQDGRIAWIGGPGWWHTVWRAAIYADRTRYRVKGGAEIYAVKLEDKYYLKTKPDGREWNNLGNVDEYTLVETKKL